MNADTPVSPEQKTSALLRQIVGEFPRKTIAVGEFVAHFRQRSFGALFILLAVVGLVPGLSFFAGIAMIVPAIQMTIGYRAPALPGFLQRQKVPLARFAAAISDAITWIERLEAYVRPRWLFMYVFPIPNLVGLAILGLAFVIMLPLPLSNLPPAIALIGVSLGLLERDGLMILIGLVATAGALAIGAVMAILAVDTVLPALLAHLS